MCYIDSEVSAEFYISSEEDNEKESNEELNNTINGEKEEVDSINSPNTGYSQEYTVCIMLMIASLCCMFITVRKLV